jgi:hypothetical protein
VGNPHDNLDQIKAAPGNRKPDGQLKNGAGKDLELLKTKSSSLASVLYMMKYDNLRVAGGQQSRNGRLSSVEQ